ncbi:hypothetical protein C1886_11215 [Pseudomonas sp. FW300-N1A1]|uniref:hypothetical protein n=1 Tax=Pseudomonas sp. FW300-N1A1 TaxID=2075555 RepID=UPI000CD10D8D|nr:hypothetical protein [Pseudomonas sp. FW300-N1A1]POA19745.1 hypothetical protein C1886_11215 [Pseudomonas sp. FW300-N1A1]
MPPLIKTITTGLILTLAISTSSLASNDKYKTIELSDDPNTTTIHYHLKNLTINKMSISTPSKKQSNAPFPLSHFDVPAKGKYEYAADFPKYFSSIAFNEATVLSETFSYASGNKECQFTASIEVRLEKQGESVERVPHWSGNGKSTGVEPADCSTEILEVMDSFPYSFSIEFSIE